MDLEKEFTTLKDAVSRIEAQLSAISCGVNNKNKIYDNSDMMQTLHISRRTLAGWREKGVISYTQYAGKIYYAQSDLDSFISKYHIKTFKYK